MNTAKEIRVFSCCICEQETKGWGNNPEPLMDNLHGELECCNSCNTEVITQRLRDLIGDKQQYNLK